MNGIPHNIGPPGGMNSLVAGAPAWNPTTMPNNNPAPTRTDPPERLGFPTRVAKPGIIDSAIVSNQPVNHNSNPSSAKTKTGGVPRVG